MADAEFAGRLRAWKASLGEQTALTVERAAAEKRIGVQVYGGALPAVLSALPARAAAALDARPSDTEPSAAPRTKGVQQLLEAAAPAVPDDLPGPLAAWLGGLAWLRGVPLRYLLADERLAPAPSLRFFHVDPHWTRALVDGAYSLARTSSWQSAHDAAAVGALRAATVPPASGLLLRSPLVDDHGPLTVAARDANDKPLDATVQPLAPGILLCLLDGIAATVEIREAPTTLHLELGGGVTTPWRGERVVNVDQLGGALAGDSGALALRLAAVGESVGYAVEAP